MEKACSSYRRCGPAVETGAPWLTGEGDLRAEPGGEREDRTALPLASGQTRAYLCAGAHYGHRGSPEGAGTGRTTVQLSSGAQHDRTRSRSSVLREPSGESNPFSASSPFRTPSNR